MLSLLAAAAENDPKDLYPKLPELFMGALTFLILFIFMWKWVLPRVNTLLEDRRAKIQGELENAEQTRATADKELAEYREQEAQATVARAQEEIRVERDRVLQELRGQIGDIAVELAARVVGKSLDKQTHEQLIDEYIDQVASSGSGQN
jgi:F-type H+-transporting ATPase subunit b